MQVFEQIRSGLAIIGLFTVIWLAYRGWQAIKVAFKSARKSNNAFQAQTVIEVVEDYGNLGAEAAWPQK